MFYDNELSLCIQPTHMSCAMCKANYSRNKMTSAKQQEKMFLWVQHNLTYQVIYLCKFYCRVIHTLSIINRHCMIWIYGKFSIKYRNKILGAMNIEKRCVHFILFIYFIRIWKSKNYKLQFDHTFQKRNYQNPPTYAQLHILIKRKNEFSPYPK